MRNPHKLPRAAHCIGCGETFDKMHEMINHRRLHRCGGRFLPASERELVMAGKMHTQKFHSTSADDYDTYRWHWTQAGDMFSRFYILRKRRLDDAALR